MNATRAVPNQIMKRANTNSQQKRQWAWNLATISLCMVIAGWGSHQNYSYWQDELVSAAAIKTDWTELFKTWIIPDTAPPLYATLLKIWSSIWGEQERSLRAMSLVATALSLIVATLSRHNSSGIRRISTILFLGLSPTLVGHAQEARNYAVTLLFSTCLIGSYTSEKRDSTTVTSQTASALLLSLSHYFGLLFAISATTAKAIRTPEKREVTWGIMTIAAMLAWPIYHLLIASRAESNLSRVEWINVQPIIGTIQEFLAGTFPVVGISAALALAAACLLSIVHAKWRRKLRSLYMSIQRIHPDIARESKLLASILALFLALTTIIDIFQPISTARNYVVALPATAFLFGNLAEICISNNKTWLRIGGTCLGIAILTCLFAQSVEDNNKFTQPMMNYKAVAQVIEKTNACTQGCYATRNYERLGVYFDLKQLRSYAGAKQANPDLLLGLGTNPMKFRKTLNDFPQLECWAPKQSIHPGVFVMVRDPKQLALKENGFMPCERT